MKRITANKLLAQIIAIKNLYLYPHTATPLSINLLSSFLFFASDLYSDWLCTVAEAMAKFVAAFFLALIALSMLQTLVRNFLPPISNKKITKLIARKSKKISKNLTLFPPFVLCSCRLCHLMGMEVTTTTAKWAIFASLLCLANNAYDCIQ